MRCTERATAMSFATRAYSRIVVRLRAQAEAVISNGGIISKLASGPATMSRTKFASPIYKPRRAPLFRVFVPSIEDWLSDAGVVECESELKRAYILHTLRPGDTVWDVAMGGEVNTGMMIWDGNFLLVSAPASGTMPSL